MGVSGLWKVSVLLLPLLGDSPLSQKLFEPIAEEYSSLKQLALREGFIKNPRQNHTLLVGVDVRCVAQKTARFLCSCLRSIWIYQSSAVFHNSSHVSLGQNPEIRTLFYKLARLLGTCAVPVFVFDGECRPSTKRGHLVRTFPYWITDDLRRLIDAFGFYSHQVSCTQLFLPTCEAAEKPTS